MDCLWIVMSVSQHSRSNNASTIISFPPCNFQNQSNVNETGKCNNVEMGFMVLANCMGLVITSLETVSIAHSTPYLVLLTCIYIFKTELRQPHGFKTKSIVATSTTWLSITSSYFYPDHKFPIHVQWLSSKFDCLIRDCKQTVPIWSVPHKQPRQCNYVPLPRVVDKLDKQWNSDNGRLSTI